MRKDSRFKLCDRCVQGGIKEFKASRPATASMVNAETLAFINNMFGEERGEGVLAMAHQSTEAWFRLNPQIAKRLVLSDDRLGAIIEAMFLGHLQQSITLECIHNPPEDNPAGQN